MAFSDIIAEWESERAERFIFHDLMRYRVREILLVGSLYDSFVVESDGFLTEQLYDEYSRLNLSTIPRVTSAYSEESALARFAAGPTDLVILMAGLDFERSFRLVAEMKRLSPATPVLLLVLNNSSLAGLDHGRPELALMDRVFVWNGYSKLLVGMIKYVEDRGNMAEDSATGRVKAILIIEDSVRYYSRYLPLLYSVLLKQTQTLIEEERGVETYRLLRAKSRPKILLACTYEEADALFHRNRHAILALITDLRFPRAGRVDPEAGFAFVDHARTLEPSLPVMIQSSEAFVRERALSIGASFAAKNSESLALELREFIRASLGFGPFRFLDRSGREIAIASTVEDFVRRVATVPLDCLLMHGARNDFSAWLTARGEYRFAGLLRDYSIEDFPSAEDLRAFLVRVLDHVRLEKSEGLLPDFDPLTFRDPASLSRLWSGSVGGKGRGLEFLRKLVDERDLRGGGLELTLPRTLFIGMDLFEQFLETNGLWSRAFYGHEDEALPSLFSAAPLPEAFLERARVFLSECRAPLILRSSGLLEDLVRLPMAGIYRSVYLPNDAPDPAARLSAFVAAIHGVWSSLFRPSVREHFARLGYSLEEERMAVVVQELVSDATWSERGPSLSGLAWSRSPLRGIAPLILSAPGLGSGLSSGRAEAAAIGSRTSGSGFIPPACRAPRTLEGFRFMDTLVEDPTAWREPDPVAWEAARDAFVAGGGPELLHRVLEAASLSFASEVVIEYAVDLAASPAALHLLQVRPVVLPPAAPEDREDLASQARPASHAYFNLVAAGARLPVS